MSTDTSASTTADTFDHNRQTSEGFVPPVDEREYVYNEAGKLISWKRNTGPMQEARQRNLRLAKAQKHVAILEAMGLGVKLERLRDDAPDPDVVLAA